MDTSNNALHITIDDLLNSPHDADKAQGEECKKILNKIVSKLKPVLKYICQPWTGESKKFMAVIVAEAEFSRKLFLLEDGSFKGMMLTDGNTYREVGIRLTEQNVFFDDLIDRLTERFSDGIDKREKYIKNLRERRKMLAKISKIMSK